MGAGLNHFTAQEALNASMGQLGCEVLSGAGTITPPDGFEFCAIIVIEETTFGAVLSNTVDGITLTTAGTIPTGAVAPAGALIPGKFSSVTIGAGGGIIWCPIVPLAPGE